MGIRMYPIIEYREVEGQSGGIKTQELQWDDFLKDASYEILKMKPEWQAKIYAGGDCLFKSHGEEWSANSDTARETFEVCAKFERREFCELVHILEDKRFAKAFERYIYLPYNISEDEYSRLSPEKQKDWNNNQDFIKILAECITATYVNDNTEGYMRVIWY